MDAADGEVRGRTAAPAGGGPGPAPAPDDTRTVVRIVLLAAVAAFVLVTGITLAASHGFLPAQVVLGTDHILVSDTNPATIAPGAQPVYESSCAFTSTPPGARCVFALGDERGNLVEQGLSIPVPKAWLQRHPHATTVNDMGVIAALVRSPYAPPAGNALETMHISVNPSYAKLLATVGVSPQRFLRWIYGHVPLRYRPAWVGG